VFLRELSKYGLNTDGAADRRWAVKLPGLAALDLLQDLVRAVEALAGLHP
jgi:hypothetical protein